MIAILMAFISVIYVGRVEGTIDPMSASYVARLIEEAESADATLIVLELDTPGGLLESMESIVKSILNAHVPIAVYVAPAGARAASAGVFIVLSGHVAAMAPGTNIGAAHPVAIGEGELSEEMKEKIEQYAASYIEAIARKRGRNVEWAKKAVLESKSITAEEAKKLGVIDILAESRDELLHKLNGWKVKIDSEQRTIETEGEDIVVVPWLFKERFFHVLSNPNIAYVLLILGIYGLIFEFAHPGAVLPGVFGAISLILAFLGLHILPINFAGVVLIILGVGLFVMEALTPTYGPFTIGGIVALTLGSILLIPRGEVPPAFRISPWLIFVVVFITASFFVFALTKAFMTRRRKPRTGMEGIIGEKGVVREAITPTKEGTVFVQGTLWKATSDVKLTKGTKVRVTGIDGLVLKVEPLNNKAADNRS